MYLVDELVIDILLRNNILVLKEIDLLFLKEIVYIDSYNMNIFIEIHLKESLIRRVINFKEIFIISLYLSVIIIIYYLNLCNYNFLFKS